MASVLPQRYEEAVDIERLIPHPFNAKLHDLEGIGKSIDHAGFAGAIYAQESTCYILSGHGTLEAAVQQGMTTVPVIWIDCDDTTAEDLLIAFNALQENAGYDADAVQLLLERAAERGVLEFVGYDADKVDDLMSSLGVQYETEEQEFEGGYADDARERMGPMPEGPKPQRGLREIVVVLDAGDMEELMGHVNNYRGEHQVATTSGKALLGIAREWAFGDQYVEVRDQQQPSSERGADGGSDGELQGVDVGSTDATV